MGNNLLNSRIESLRRRIGELQQDRAQVSSPADDAFVAALADLAEALEELRADEESVRRQNEQLLAAREAVDQQRRRYEELFEYAPDGYVVTDAKRIILQANRAAAAMFNTARDRLVGRSLAIFVAKEDRAGFRAQLPALGKRGAVQDLEMRVRPRKKKPFPVQVSVVVRGAKGEPASLRWILRDISHRKQAEGALKESEERFRALAESIDDWAWEVDAEGRYTYCSPRVKDLLGYDVSEVLGKTPFDLMDPDEAERVGELFASIAAEGRPLVALENVNLHRSGRRVVLETSGRPFFDSEGNLKGYRGIDRDITDRKRAEDALKESEERYHYLVEAMNEGLASADENYVFSFVNERFCRMLGYAREDMVGHKLIEFVHEDDKELMSRQMTERRQGRTSRFELAWRAKDGRKIHTLASPKGVYGADGAFVGSSGVLTDITDLKNAQEALRRERDNLTNILDTMTDGVYIANRDYDIEYVNPALVKEFGPVRGRKCYDYFHNRKEVCPWCMNDGVFEGETVQWEWYSPRNQKTYDLIDTPIRNPDGTMSRLEIFRDVTERKRVEEDLRRSMERFRTYFDIGLVGMAITSPDKGWVEVNDRLCELLGYCREELLAKTWAELTVPEDLPQEVAQFERVLAGEIDGYSMEKGFVCKNGEVIDAITSARCVRREDGSVDHLVAMVQDITEMKQAQEALRESGEFVQTVMNAIPDPTMVVDRDYRVLLANEAAQKLVGGVDPVAACMACYQVSHNRQIPCKGELYPCPLEIIARTKAPTRVVHTHYDAEGNAMIVEVNAAPIFDDKGEVIQIIQSCRDITERKRAEEEVADLAKFPSENPNPVLRIGRDGTVLYGNDASAPVLEEWGRGQGEPLTGRWHRFVLDALDTARNLRAELRCGERILALTFAPVVDSGYVNVYAHDVTERKRAEERAADLARFPAENPSPVLRIARSGDVLYFNDASGPLLKAWECGRGQPLTGRWQQLVLEALTSADARHAELECDGRVFSLTFSPVVESDYVNIYAHDITARRRAEQERRKLELQVQHTQKLESLGVLAGGIAHDFNNLLVAILGNAELALRDLSEVSPARGSVEEIRKASVRAAELTGQMLAYSGKGSFVVRPLDLNDLVHEMGHLLEVSISKRTALKYDLAPDLPAVEADASQIRQVVMNLITNASDAIGGRSGAITVRTDVVDMTRSYLEEMYVDEALPEGCYVCLEVSDTGGGMDSDTLPKIFDPFFSTKFAGRGLGLAAVLGIVRGHRGAIGVHSEVGKGTTFRVFLPCTEKELPTPAEGAEPAVESWRGSGTVLIVDDEESVRNVARAMLERFGLTVLTAPDGHSGVETFRRYKDELVLVLLDMTMPRMSGEEAFKEMHEIRPDVPIILASGYEQEDATSHFIGKGLAGFIQKPFQLSALIGKVRAAIESS